MALSPCVSVVPSAHGFVTGEASGLGRTAIPYRRLSSCSTRAWTVFVGCMLPAAQRRLWLRRCTPLPQDSAATRRPHPLFHRRPPLLRETTRFLFSRSQYPSHAHATTTLARSAIANSYNHRRIGATCLATTAAWKAHRPRFVRHFVISPNLT